MAFDLSNSPLRGKKSTELRYLTTARHLLDNRRYANGEVI